MYSGSELNKRCPRCNAPLTEGATTCPNCGQIISSVDPTIRASQGTPGDPYNPGNPYAQQSSPYGQNPSPYGQNLPYGQNPSPYGQTPLYGQRSAYEAQTPLPPQLPFSPMSSQPPFSPMLAPPPQKKLSPWMVGAIVVCVIVLVGGGALLVSAFNANQAQMHTNATATAQTQGHLHATATAQAIAKAIDDPHIPAGANATLTLNDPLTQPGNWPSATQCQFEADGYHVSTVAANKFHGCEAAGSYTNTSLQAGVKLLRGPCVGLITRDNGQTNFNGYLALVCNDNSYSINVLTNGAGKLLDEGTTTVFHPNPKQENILTLVANRQTIEFYVNGTKVSSVSNSQYMGQGQLGLISVSNNTPGSEAVFDHAKVWTF